MSDKKNPSRTIFLGAVAVGVLLTVVVWPLSMLGKGGASPADADEAELRIQPVARVEMQKAESVKSDGKPRSGEAIYASVCKACHEAGVAGAPKTGDKAAWAPRLATGMAALLKSATNGKNAMPARGGAPDLSDDELKAAVTYLTGKAK
ncbi:c-type cytochrome [uncultured Propionivibrio sp.]|uniref:c-type cytochrome n=1 Tax=uncultured Propionivibrio sp. TaxID=426737 RepID=UPI0029BFFA9C|nr:c-type cytochrome [uncultured Propionivibrio sp.]